MHEILDQVHLPPEIPEVIIKGLRRAGEMGRQILQVAQLNRNGCAALATFDVGRKNSGIYH